MNSLETEDLSVLANGNSLGSLEFLFILLTLLLQWAVCGKSKLVGIQENKEWYQPNALNAVL